MTESVIADFPARFLADSTIQDGPVRGRVLLSERRLLLATGDETHEVPLSCVFDLSVGQVPPNVSEFFDDTVTIGYERDGAQRRAVVEGDSERIERFSTILFRVQLGGARATVRHPARVGGRVMDTPPEDGSIKIGEKAVTFRDRSEPVTIDLFDVIDVREESRTIDGTTQPALLVRHVPEGRTVTTEITLSSPRERHLLGRYLRLEYSELLRQVREVDIADAELELLVALYSGVEVDPDENGTLAGMLDLEDDRVDALLDELAEKGLLDRASETTALTSRGRVMIGDRMEDINI